MESDTVPRFSVEMMYDEITCHHAENQSNIFTNICNTPDMILRLLEYLKRAGIVAVDLEVIFMVIGKMHELYR